MHDSTTHNWESSICLDDDQLQDTWRRYLQTRDDALRNALVDHYLGRVKHYCRWYHAKLPRTVSLDEVVSLGVRGLCAAVKRFDPAMGVKFQTYCNARARGAILDGLRKMDRVPRHVRVRINHLKRCCNELTAALGRRPDDEELAEYAGMESAALQRLKAQARSARRVSLDAPVGRTADRPAPSSVQLVEDKGTASPVRRAQHNDLRDLVTQGLSRDERNIIILYYYDQLTMREIGQVLGRSESRISQMHAAVLARLRQKLADRRDEFVN